MNPCHKRNRNIDEKINDAIEKIKDLEPSTKEKMVTFLKEEHRDLSSVTKISRMIRDFLGIKAIGRNTVGYWVSRGWSIEIANFKVSDYFKNNKIKMISPFSQEHWMQRINPETGLKYTKEEADFKRNSLRPIRKEYWMIRGFSEEEAILKSLEVKRENNKKGSEASSKISSKYNSKRCKEYWMIRGFSEEEAKEQVSNSQKTFSLDLCIEKYGEDAGRKVWLDRQEKWHKNYKKSNFSKISQTLFWDIIENLSDISCIYFAELDKNKTKDTSGRNHEKRLRLKDRVVLPDFLDEKNKKIIEFNGAYWHDKDIHANKHKDQERIDSLRECGYNVLIVDELDFNKYRKETIEECLSFLNEPQENLLSLLL